MLELESRYSTPFCSGDPPASANPSRVTVPLMVTSIQKACLGFVNLGSMNGDVDTIYFYHREAGLARF